jgi:hypothetical protein
MAAMRDKVKISQLKIGRKALFAGDAISEKQIRRLPAMNATLEISEYSVSDLRALACNF